MGWYFNETNERYITLGDHAALSLPDGDWTIAGWIKLDDNVGTAFQYFLSWGALAATPSVNWYITEASYTTTAQRNKLSLNIVDDDGSTTGVVYGTSNAGSSTNWQHFVLQRTNGVITQYVNGVADGSWTPAGFNGVNVSGNLYFGLRSDLDAARRLGGYMAEWAKWDRALDIHEIAALVAGMVPTNLPADLKWYCPMFDDFSEAVVPLTVTNSNATVDDGTHPLDYGSAPSQAANPQPVDAQTWASRTPTLAWNSTAATSFDVYFGESQSLVAAGDASVFMGNQAGASYAPGTLDPNRTYYWRIDAKNAAGTTEGEVWSFKTGWTYSYANANDFGDDPNCVALWRFEDGALGTDSSGNTNTLSTSYVTADTATYKQGAAAADFERSTLASLAYRSDTTLTSNFPLKSTYASAVAVSFCCWFKPESLPSGGTNDNWYSLWGKWTQTAVSSDRSMALSVYRGPSSPDAVRLIFQKGYSDGSLNEFTLHPTALIAGRWYHVGVTYDDSTGAVRIRLWDDTEQAVTEIVATHAQALHLNTERLSVGTRQSYYGDAYQYDGLIDEAVFLSEILTADQIDRIRAGRYPNAIPKPPAPGQEIRNMLMGFSF